MNGSLNLRVLTGVLIAAGVGGCSTLANQPSAVSGELDVTTPRYGAAGDGVTDDTNAIQRAIDDGRGRTVYFPPGVYLFSSSLVNTEDVTLRGAHRNASILRMTRDEPYGVNLASGLRVRSLTIRGNSAPSPRAYGFNGGNTNGAVVEDCIIEHWGAVAILGADHSSRNVVRNNIIRHNAHEGVYFGTDSHENLVEGNYIHHNGKNGVDVNGSRNRILNNVVHDIGEAGDTVDTVGIMAGSPLPDRSTGNLIDGNTVYRCATHGIMLWANSAYNTVTRNAVFDNDVYGIFLEKLGEDRRCADHIVAQNVCRGNGSYGIILEAAVDSIVSGNQCIGNGRDGIAIDSTNGPAERNVVSDNVSRENERYGLFISPGTRETTVDGNALTENKAGDFVDQRE